MIHSYIKLIRCKGVDLVLIQDRAPRHIAKDTRQDLLERRIRVIFWPPFSLDLNPIKRV